MPAGFGAAFAVPAGSGAPPPSDEPPTVYSPEALARLEDMGFSADAAKAALTKHRGNEEAAVDELLANAADGDDDDNGS